MPLSETARDISLTPAGAARVALRQLSPKPYGGRPRRRASPPLERFLEADGRLPRSVWLSDGVDTGEAARNSCDALGKPIGERRA